MNFLGWLLSYPLDWFVRLAEWVLGKMPSNEDD